MAEREILTWPNPILCQVSKPVEEITEKIKDFCQDLRQTLYVNDHAIGLAAPQIGENLRIFVIDIWWRGNFEDKKPIIFINPEITAVDDWKAEMQEGCLSVPGIVTRILRPSKVNVKFLALDGSKCEINAEGLLAQCIQHENDHLDGKVIFDRIWGMRKQRLLKEYKPPHEGKYMYSEKYAPAGTTDQKG